MIDLTGLNMFDMAASVHSSPITPNRDEQEAYRIYTSGSTGEPKAVVILEAGCRNLIDYFIHLTGADSRMSWLSATSISFDIFYLEYAIPLVTGGKLILLSDKQRDSVQEIAHELINTNPDIFQATPSMFKCLLPYLPASWKFNNVLVGGEKLSTQLSAQLYARSAWLCNVYGPTETTVWSTAHVIKNPGDNRIGKPIYNTVIQVLDGDCHKVLNGEQGRIFIGGKGVAQGYFNSPELTAEKFQSFTGPDFSGKLYDTGDIGYIDSDGILNYLYRDGDFFKVNGYRIDTSEVVDELEKIPSVAEAAVIVVEVPEEDEAILVAWLKKAENRNTLDMEAIRTTLSSQLSHYMIPRFLYETNALPYSISGKLDKKSLIAMTKAKRSSLSDSLYSPETARNGATAGRSLLGILANYIDTDGLSEEDNLFHRGLSSMNAVSLHLDLMELYPDVELHDIFDRPTIQSLLAPYATT